MAANPGLATLMLPYRSLLRRQVEMAAPGPLQELAVRATKSSPWRPHNDTFRTVFIHVPRTGGRSVSTALFTGEDSGHPTAYDYRAFDPQRFERYYKFTIVRNPWDKLVSSFHRVKHSAQTPRTREWGEVMLKDTPDFDAFVARLGDDMFFRQRVLSNSHFRPQYEYVTVKGALAVDFVGRFEQIDDDFRTIAKKLQLDTELPLSNQSAHTYFKDYYSPAMVEIVAEVYAKDLQLFGYRYDQ